MFFLLILYCRRLSVCDPYHTVREHFLRSLMSGASAWELGSQKLSSVRDAGLLSIQRFCDLHGVCSQVDLQSKVHKPAFQNLGGYGEIYSEDGVKSLQNSRCSAKLVSVQVSA